jgi:hypothetical protein
VRPEPTEPGRLRSVRPVAFLSAMDLGLCSTCFSAGFLPAVTVTMRRLSAVGDGGDAGGCGERDGRGEWMGGQKSPTTR